MRILTPLALVLMIAMPVSADECVPTTSPTLASACYPDGVGLYGECDYVAVDDCLFALECIPGVWHYFEANDIPGLQRGDVDHDDTCGGMIQSDGLIS